MLGETQTVISKEGSQAEPVAKYRSLVRVPGFTNLVVASTCARTAIRMYQVLLVLFVLKQYRSPGLSGLVVFASQVPGILFSPIAGALLDRRGRVLLMAIDYLVASVSIALVIVLSLTHLLSLSLLFVIVIVGSFTQPLSSTGARSLFPVMVPRHLWDRCNGLDGTTYVIATALGPAAAGIGVAVVGSVWALSMPVLAYLFGAISLIGVRAPSPTNEAPGRILADAVGAVRYVLSHRVLRQLSATLTVFTAAAGATTVVVPVLVLRHLHGGSMTTGMMISTLGLAGFVSSVITGALGTADREHPFMIGACLCEGFGLALLALCGHDEVLAFVGLAITGMANGPMVVTMFTVRQRVTDPKWFGRAFAVSMNLNIAGLPIVAAIVGVIAAHSVAWAFWFMAAIILLAGIWTAVFRFDFDDH